MLDYPTISKTQPAFPDYLDFQVLRRIGIEQVQALSSQIWTDYNLHDPGVTILEVLCYAVTDLGYRNNLDIKDLLTRNPADPKSKETNFFTSDQILTCNPVTELDWRKRLIDISGVRNAWLEKVGIANPRSFDQEKGETYEPAIYADAVNGRLQYTLPVGQTEAQALRINPKGLYRICLDLEPDRRKDACGQIYRSWADTLKEVEAVLCRHRNLCEDFHDVVILGEEEIGLCTDIELEAGADPEDVQVEIYIQVQAFLAPRLRFYTLQELLAQGKSPADIFAGRPSPLHDETTRYDSHGFIDTAELAALEPPKMLHTSDFYQIIMDVPGVSAIKKLSLINYINGLRQSEGDAWCLHLTEKHRPVLGIEQSRVTFFKGDLPFKADAEEVKRRYYEQQVAHIKAPRDAFELDLPVPRGSYYDLADHYSIHHDFPLTYGVGEDGLPDTAPPLRKAQAKQLKGYLIFFDQVLANYLAQLAHVRDLFSWEKETDRRNHGDRNGWQPHQGTYFTQALTNVPGVQEIIRHYHRCPGSDLPGEELDESGEFVDYVSWLNAIREDPLTYRDRRSRFLDHLLARFAETFTDYVLLNYKVTGGRRDETDILDDKVRFLQDYPILSRDRLRAFNYCDCDEIWDTNNVSGFQKRVSRLLGIDIDSLTNQEKFWRRSLSHYEILHEKKSFRLALRSSLNHFSSLSFHNKLSYPDWATAHTHLKTFLSIAFNPAHYKPLAYRYYSRYLWDVTDRQGYTLVTYDHQFHSQAERDAALDNLLRDLQAALGIPIGTDGVEPPVRSNIIQLERIENNTKTTFKLKIEAASQTIVFNSKNQYEADLDASMAAEEALDQIQNKEAYRPDLVNLTYYGFGLIDEEGQLLAEGESAARFEQKHDRNSALQRWLSQLQANQNEVSVKSSTTCFFFELKDRTGDGTFLRGLDGVPTRNAAEDQIVRVLSDGKSRSAYHLIDEAEFNFVLVLDSDIPFAQHPQYYATNIERNLRLDALLYYLNRPTPISRIEGETGTYGATLLDRDSNPLLITYHTYSTQSQAGAAYQRLLHLASDPVYFQPINSLPGELRYGFVLVDRRGNPFATHPNGYASSCQRDLVIRSIVNYVNEDINRRLVNQDTGVYYELLDQTNSPLLVGEIAYADEITANAAFNEMVNLARDRANYQLIDNATGHCPYGFTLYNGSTLLASHPDYYDTSMERDQALQALINLVISDEPLYQIGGAEGQFSYALVDVLAVSENPSDLLTSAVTYPDAEAAQLAFTQMLTHAALIDRYRRLDDLPTPQSFSFELSDAAGELIARHLDSDGHPLGYATASEREAAIEKIAYYAAQVQIRYIILNPEGAFFAEVWEADNEGLHNDKATPLWTGRKTFSDTTAATVEVDRIRALACQPESYFPIQTEIGTCPYTFALKDETDEVIADHPSFYRTAAERDRQVQQLWRRFRGPTAFVQIQEIPASEPDLSGFTFEIPADLFCLFQNCDADQQQAFQSGAILRSPDGETFATEEVTREAFLRCLTLVLDDQNIEREYRNTVCEFTFDLTTTDPTTKTKSVVATSHPRVYRSRAEMERAIDFIQQVARGLTITPKTPGTCCGYYFFVAIPGTNDAALKSLRRYPTEERAWQAAGAFAEHLRYRRRYISPAVDAAGQSYSLGITDAVGNLLAATDLEQDLDDVFRGLNSVEPFLQSEVVPEVPEGEVSTYRFRLVDRTEHELLVGSRAQPDSETAYTHFYRDVLSLLFEPGVIEPTATNGGAPFSFRVVSLPISPGDTALVLATHPQTYSSAILRDEQISHLLLLIRTNRLITEVEQQLPAFTGKIYDQDTDDKKRQPLLRTTQRHSYVLAHLGTVNADGSLLPTWYLEGETWQNLRSSLVELATNGQLTVQAISFQGEGSRGNTYRFQLVARETVWLVSHNSYRNQSEAEAAGRSAIDLLSPQNDQARHRLQEAFYERQRHVPLQEQGEGEWRLVAVEWTLVLLDPDGKDNAKEAACKDGNSLVELAGKERTPKAAHLPTDMDEKKDNFRLIDAEDRSCLYSWELTNKGGEQLLAVSPGLFSSPKQRDDAIDALQARINDEGFHVVEHILLRPKHPPLDPICSFPPDDALLQGVNPKNALPFRASLTVQNGPDLFSFTVEGERGETLFQSESFSTELERNQAIERLMLSGLPEEATGEPPIDHYEIQQDFQGHSFICKADADRAIGQSRTFASLNELETQKQWLQNNLHKFAPQLGIDDARLRQWQEQQEPRDNYDLAQTSRTGQAGFEKLFNRERDRYYFHVNDCRGNALFYSEAYRGKASRDKGLRSVIRNSVIEAHYTLKKIPGPALTVYFFTLRATNGQEIGRSRYFDALWKLEVCLDWFKHNVHQSAQDFGVRLAVPADLIESKPIADDFLPIAKAATNTPDLSCSAAYDPYSFWVSVILPYWPARFRDMNFRRLVERTLRLEAPAHVALKICWVDVCQMHEFEVAYRHWLEQLALETCQDAACALPESLNSLIAILSQLNNVYPEGTLHDCDESGPDDNPIILNQTALGTANE